MDKKKELMKNTLVFSFGVFGAKLMQFLLVPLYTIYMTSSSFNTADLIISTVSLLLPFLTLGMAHGILRFSIGKAENRKSLLLFSLPLCFIGCALLFLATPVLKMTKLFDGYELYIPVLFLLSSSKTILANYCKSIDKNRVFAIEGIMSATLIALLSWLFLGYFKFGVQGYLLAYIISNAISVIYFIITCTILSTIKKGVYRIEVIKETLRYSIPLMPNDLAWWIIHMSDRYMVTWICGAAISGIYTIAYKIPGIFNMIVSIFNQAFSLSAFKECDMNGKNADGKYNGSFFESVYSKYLTIVSLSASFVILVTQPVAYICIKNEFYSSWRYTAYLLIAFVIGGVEAYFAGILTGIKKTDICFISTVAGAIANVVVNLALIPVLQTYGAIIGTIVGYLIVYIIRLIGVKKNVAMNTYDKTSFTSLAVIAIQCFCYAQDKLAIRLLSIFGFVVLFIIHFKNIKYFTNAIVKKFKHQG